MPQHADLTITRDATRLSSARARRNRAEALVRDRLAPVDDVYVLRSSWRANGNGTEPFVAVIARTDGARDTARRALREVAGLPDDLWITGWTSLSLGDSLISVFPERAAEEQE